MWPLPIILNYILRGESVRGRVAPRIQMFPLIAMMQRSCFAAANSGSGWSVIAASNHSAQLSSYQYE
jgi:hypothetical protein